MFFRHLSGGRRKAIDLEGIFKGPLFLCGGNPTLKKEDLSQLHERGIVTMVMNNTASLVRPNIWICADIPQCYSTSIITDPAPLKFARLRHQDKKIFEDGYLWRDVPNTYFYGDTTSKSYGVSNFLNKGTPIIWWKNVFTISLQIANMLGFDKIYLCGVGFSISEESQYAYDTSLDAEQVKYNQKCYDGVLNLISKLLPHFRNKNFELVSCTPDSKINSLIPFKTLSDAIREVTSTYPEVNTLDVFHSSKLGS